MSSYFEFALKGRGKQSKKKTTLLDTTWDWDLQRERSLDISVQLLKLDINRLWDPPIVEEEFVR